MAQQVATLLLLSGSTSGEPIQIAATATLGTTVHQTPNTTTTVDQIWLYVTNTDNASHTLTIEFGAAGAGKNIDIAIPGKSIGLPIPGIPLTNNLLVTAFADVTNVLNVYGYINRIG